MWSAEFLARACNARMTGPEQQFTSVSNDTRRIQPGALYVALRGENFDGHRFVAKAIDLGASGVLVSEPVPSAAAVTTLTVSDTLLALQQIGLASRRRFPGPVVAVTGSNGKTSTRQLLASVLRAHFGDSAVLSTEGNYNNHIGVPLTLLRLSGEHRAAVVEMGMSHFNELALLTSLALPTVSVITNAGPAHLEGVGTVAGVAKAKAEIFLSMGPGATAILNADDYFLPYWEVVNRNRSCVRFGFGDRADVRGEFDVENSMLKVTRGLDQTLSVKLPFAGEHNGRNALAAIGVAKALGVSAENMKRGLETATNIGGRLARREISQHIHVIDDSYNANPASVMAGLQVLVEESNNKILVLGDMAELGDHSDDLHRSLLEAIERSPVDEVLTLGPRLKRAAGALAGRTQAFLELDELVERLRKTPVRATTILVKGAHSMAMHRVIERVEAMHGGKN